MTEDTPEVAESRKRFEAWISAPPYERKADRWTHDPDAAWPGQYIHISTHLAWDAWEESRRQMEARCSSKP